VPKGVLGSVLQLGGRGGRKANENHQHESRNHFQKEHGRKKKMNEDATDMMLRAIMLFWERASARVPQLAKTALVTSTPMKTPLKTGRRSTPASGFRMHVLSLVNGWNEPPV
jgi:hypothetical protein